MQRMSAAIQRTSRSAIGTARLLAGLSAIAVASTAAPALAANECGTTTTGTVVCTSAGNPYASGITYSTPSDVSITTNPDVVAQGTVSATSATGAATVTSNGQIATTTANTNGITATAPGNVAVTAVSVTTSGVNSAGIAAKSTAGTITVNSTAVAVSANGGAGIIALGQNAVTVNSGSASALNESAVYVRSTTGSATISLTGATSTTTADAAVTAISGSTVTVNVAAGATVTGTNALALSPLNSSTSTITNAGTLTGTNGYAILAKFGTTTVTNTGTINSGVEFINAGSSLVNSGTFNVTEYSVFGTGAGGSLINTGLVQVTSAAPASGVTFYALASFANSGTLSLANGRAGDVLTLSGSFTGSGASRLLLDTAPGFAPDQVVIGGAATGVTTIQLINNGGNGGLLNPGTVVVSAGAGTSPTAFQLAAASVNNGFVQNALVFNAATNAFSLVATPSASAYRTLDYAEGARNIWYKTSEVWEAHMRDLREGTGDDRRLWGQFYGSADTRRDGITTSVFGQTAAQDLSYRQDEFGGQLGLDIAQPTGNGGLTFGITAGYVNSDMQFLGTDARARFNVANVGGYAGFHVGGVFVNVLGLYAHDWIKASDPNVGFPLYLHGDTYGATGEAGFRFGDDKLFVEPLATLSYVRTNLNDITALSSTFNFQDSDGVRGKLGARFGTSQDFAGGKLTFYGGGNAVKAFEGRDTLVFTNNGTSLGFGDNKIGLYGEGYAGLSIASRNNVSGFLEGFGDYGGRDTQRGGGGRAGLRVSF